MTITLDQITVKYQDMIVLNNVNAEFKSNQTYCIMGESGKGKTTLLHTIMGLVKPSKGTITGMEHLKIGAVFQEERLLEDNTVLDNILFIMNKSDEKKKSEIFQACKEVGLSGYEHKKVKELSGGMKRRVSLLRALLSDFDLLLLDEPLKGLDYNNKYKITKYITGYLNHLTKKKEIITIMVTHDKEEVDMIQGVVYSM